MSLTRWIDERPDAITAGRRQCEVSEQKVVQALALNVKDVGRHFVDIRGIHGVRVCDQHIRRGGQQIRRRTRIAREPPYLASDSGRDDLNDRELRVLMVFPARGRQLDFGEVFSVGTPRVDLHEG